MLSETMHGMLEGLVAVNDGVVPYVGSYKSTLPQAATRAKSIR